MSNPKLLSEPAVKAINNGVDENGLLISPISVWEVALLVHKSGLSLLMDLLDWVFKSGRLPFVRFVPVDNSIAIRSVNLPEPFHRDPADRMIVSTAIAEGARLVTRDDKLLGYSHVKTVW